jgi:hypothetical protein
MKSKQFRIFLTNLSELNNSFTHYSFVWNQFLIDYNELIEEKPNDLTQDTFNRNPFVEKHNIKLGKLTEEHEKTNKTLIEGIYLLTFSYYESYLKAIMEFSCLVDNTIPALEEKLDIEENDNTLIDKIINRTRIDKSKVDLRELLTLDYLRLRRNRVIHRNSESISRSLNELIKNEGKILNEYWNKKLRTGLQEIDFYSKEKANDINFNFIIDIINILRIIIEHFDWQILNALGEEKVVKQVVIPDFLKQQGGKITQYTSERLLKKFKRFSKAEYVIETNDIIDRELLDAL